MLKTKFRCKINMIMLLILPFCAAVPAGHCLAEQQAYTIQVMSGADKGAASRFAEELKKKGFDASVAELSENEKPVYKVRVGSFMQKKDAAQLHETLRTKGIEGWITQVQVPEQPVQKHDEVKAIAVQTHPNETAAKKKAATDNKTEAEAQAEPEPAAEEKPFVLIINPVPTFAEQKTAAAASAKTADIPAVQPLKTYKYFNPGDTCIHITTSLETIPAQYRRHIGEISIYPVSFISINLRDISLKINIEGTNREVLLEGLTQPDHVPPEQAVRDFEAALETAPLRLKYYPQRTDPDGTLHGSLFFKDGASVERDMVRRELAACDKDNFPWSQNKACEDTDGKPRPSAETEQQ
jgi:hypothetical protein